MALSVIVSGPNPDHQIQRSYKDGQKAVSEVADHRSITGGNIDRFSPELIRARNRCTRHPITNGDRRNRLGPDTQAKRSVKRQIGFREDTSDRANTPLDMPLCVGNGLSGSPSCFESEMSRQTRR